MIIVVSRVDEEPELDVEVFDSPELAIERLQGEPEHSSWLYSWKDTDNGYASIRSFFPVAEVIVELKEFVQSKEQVIFCVCGNFDSPGCKCPREDSRV